MKSKFSVGREERIIKYKESKLNKLENVDQNQVEEQLGYAFGEIIYLTKLPTLSIDGIKSNNCIKITEQEENIFIVYNDKWFELYSKDKDSEESKKSWSDLLKYRYKIQEKYLPKELECIFYNIFVKDWDSFKNGLRSSLWDSDICHYDIENNDSIAIDNSDCHFTKIILKLVKLK